jgi:alpha-galactosidase
MKQKLVIVGAGSAMFTQGIVRDWLGRKQRHEWELALVDPNLEILAATERLVRYAIERAGGSLQVSASPDIQSALAGATLVICTIGVGGRRAWEQDVLIPRKYGIFQSVGDSVMPGGISRALRMIPEVLTIAQHVEKVCPSARFINYANPMTAILRALHRFTGLDAIGLCSGLHETLRYLAGYAGVALEKVTARWAGINHLTWILDARADGVTLWPRFYDGLTVGNVVRPEVLGRMFWDEGWEPSPACREEAIFSWELFAEFGAFPAPMDRHVVEFFPERFRGGRYYGKTLGVDAFSFEGCIAYGDRIFQRTMELGKYLGSQPTPDPSLVDDFGGEPSQLLDIVEDMELDRRHWYSVNVPNRGSVTNLPDDAILELPAATMSSGFWVPRIGTIPASLAALLLRRLAAVEATVEAAMSGNRRLVAEAMVLDGGVSDYDVAVRLANEMVESHKEYLPQFC